MKRTIATWCAALALLLTACTIEEPAITVETGGLGALGAPATPGLVDSAANQTAAAESARFTMSMTMEAAALASPVLMEIEGEIAEQGEAMSMTMDLSGWIGAIEADPTFGAGSDMLEGMFSEPMEYRIIGADVYMRAPFLDMFGGAGQWAHFTDPAMAEEMSASGTVTPSDVLGLLRTIDEDVVDHGVEEIDGVNARRLSGGLDFEELAASGDQEEIDDMLEQLEALSIDPTTIRTGDLFAYDAWIDGDGRLIGMDFEFRLADGGAGMGRFAAQVSMRFFDFDEPISIEHPAPADVFELPGYFN